MKLCIDRFEGEYAICEDDERQPCRILRSLLPSEAKEGDWLSGDDSGWTIDMVTTQEVSERIKTKMNSLWNN